MLGLFVQVHLLYWARSRSDVQKLCALIRKNKYYPGFEDISQHFGALPVVTDKGKGSSWTVMAILGHFLKKR
jgi:hypothetical protein